jgi:hypothetical protein
MTWLMERVLRWLHRTLVRKMGGKCKRCGATEKLLIFHDGLWCPKCTAEDDPDFFEEGP